MSPHSSLALDAGFLAAIRDNPCDNPPRLIYADWLEENGEAARSAFIRLQCEATGLPTGSRERRAKERKAEALLRAHKAEWFGPLWKAFYSRKPKGSQLVLDRGFVVGVSGDARAVLKHATDLDRYAPVLRRLEVGWAGGLVGQLLRLPVVRRVPELGLTELDSSGVGELAEPFVSDGLECLSLGFEFTDERDTLDGIGHTPIVQSARCLNLHFGFFLRTDEVPEVGLAAAQEPTIRELNRLTMSHLRGLGFGGLTAESAAALAAWPGLARLDWLDFHTSFADDAGVTTLLDAPDLPRLRRLNLNENHLTDETARGLAMCQRLSELSSLALDWNELTDAGAESLAASVTLPASLLLDVSFNGLTARGVERLRDRFGRGVVSEKQF